LHVLSLVFFTSLNYKEAGLMGRDIQ
jgi:hypothetical protein